MGKELMVIIENRNGVNVVSSRVVAEQLEKEHRRVMQDCREKLEDGVEFVQSSYINSQNKEQPELLLTKDGFILLCMNYQGYNDFKRAYINKFNEMEKELNKKLTVKEIETNLNNSKAKIAFISLNLIRVSNDESYREKAIKDTLDFLLQADSNVLKLKRKTFSAEEIGKLFGLTYTNVGRIANSYNLKTPKYGEYDVYACNRLKRWKYYDTVFPEFEKILCSIEGKKYKKMGKIK